MKSTDPEPSDGVTRATPEEIAKLKEEGAQYKHADLKALSKREDGTDFSGSLTDFALTFEWVWQDDDKKSLIEKSSGEKFSGWAHISDKRLDPSTYPGQKQSVKFVDGYYDFPESLKANE